MIQVGQSPPGQGGRPRSRWRLIRRPPDSASSVHQEHAGAAAAAATAVDETAIDSVNAAASARSELKDGRGATASGAPSSSLPTPEPPPPTGRRPPAAWSKAASRSGHLRPVRAPAGAHLSAQLRAVRPEWRPGAQPAPPFGEPRQHRRGPALTPRRNPAAGSRDPLGPG